MHAQVLEKDIPPGTSAVDCNGTEASLLDCISSAPFGIQQECSSVGSTKDATVLACGSTSVGVARAASRISAQIHHGLRTKNKLPGVCRMWQGRASADIAVELRMNFSHKGNQTNM